MPEFASQYHNKDIAFFWNRDFVFVSYVRFSDRLCGLVVRVPGYTTEMYCVSCEVRTEF
jgi:hypothetical protein